MKRMRAERTAAAINDGAATERGSMPCRMLLMAAVLAVAMTAGPAAAQEARVETERPTYEIGETISIVFSGLPGNRSDWINIVPQDAPDRTWGSWRYTQGAEEGVMEFAGPREAGIYETRLYFDWAGTGAYDVQHRHVFYVGIEPPAEEEPAAETQAPEEGAEPGLPEDGGGLVWTDSHVYEPGAPITVHFRNMPGNTSDWINIVPFDASEETWGEWKYTRGETEGMLEYRGRDQGRYQVRVYFDWANTRSYEVQDRHTFFIGAAPQVTEGPVGIERDVHVTGEPITVFFSGLPGNNTDWITIVPADARDSAWGDWKYTRGNTEGVLEFGPKAPGEYEIRVYYDWAGGGGYEVQHRHRFTVVPEDAG